jgi:Protein of unknown function (DUF1585)
MNRLIHVRKIEDRKILVVISLSSIFLTSLLRAPARGSPWWRDATVAALRFADREVIEQVVRDARAKNHGLRSIVHAIVQSRRFLNK